MNEISKGRKLAGKIFAAVTILLLAAVLAASWYIGGQKKAVTMLCEAAAAGDHKDFISIYSPSDGKEITEEYVKSLMATHCRFTELDSTSIIGSDVDFDLHRFDGDKWICSADVRFFYSGQCFDFENTVFEMTFSGGKWKIINIYSE